MTPRNVQFMIEEHEWDVCPRCGSPATVIGCKLYCPTCGMNEDIEEDEE